MNKDEASGLFKELARIRKLNATLKIENAALVDTLIEACEQRDLLAIALLKKRLTPNEKDWLQ